MRQFLCVVIFMTTLSTVIAEEKPLDASVTFIGALQLRVGDKSVCAFSPGAYEKGWRGVSASGNYKEPPKDPGARTFNIKTAAGGPIKGDATFAAKGAAVIAAYSFTPQEDVELNSLHVSADFSIEKLVGGKWKADDKDGEFPAEFKDVHMFSAPCKKLVLEMPSGLALTLDFTEPTPVLLQDNRKWGPSFSVRIGPQSETKYKKGEAQKIAFNLSANRQVNLTEDGITTITAGPEWIPLKLELDIEAGTALDFSNQGFQDAPAGKHGRVLAKNGNFEFEKKPGVAQRFYGVNFCFGAHYLAHEESDRIADRIARLGYNTIRIHHYEGELAKDQPDSTEFNATKLDQFDYLLAALIKRGIYLTTDMFVSRPVKWKTLGIEKDGNVPMNTFKIMVPVVPAAFENWKKFSKALLDHVNPYTKVRYADEAALAWLCMINEGNFGNFMGDVRGIPEWTREWNAWLAKRYGDKDKLAAAWGKLNDGEDLAKGTVALPTNLGDGGGRERDCKLFFTDVEVDMMKKMREFLHKDLGCKALISNANAWTNFFCSQVARQEYDYVDDHYYIDHPHFLEKSWNLPSSCPNTSPIATGASGGRHTTFTRLFDKPFTISEYNYSGPGRYRGVGGILTGAMGALQGWGGIWRFAYGHSRDGLLQPSRIDYFNMATDPLSQASERASLCLYLRGDMKTAPNSISITATRKGAMDVSPMPGICPPWHWAAWVTKVGTQIVPGDGATGPQLSLGAGNPYDGKSLDLPAMLKQKGILAANNPTDPAKNIFRSETGEIIIDAPEDRMTLDTPRTAGGYAPVGKEIATADKGLVVTMQESDATVFVNALDDQPIKSSKRLLLTHLTDLQNTNIKYAEKARQTLLAWGTIPHLVRAGKAAVKLKHADAAKLKVWALATSGKRIAEVKAAANGDTLEFTADVAEGAAENGARMLYEIAEK